MQLPWGCFNSGLICSVPDLNKLKLILWHFSFSSDISHCINFHDQDLGVFHECSGICHEFGSMAFDGYFMRMKKLLFVGYCS